MKNNMKIRKGDTVLIISGKDKGKRGKILSVSIKEKQILVEGINLIKKHRRPTKGGEKGQIISLPSKIDVSNLKLVCPKCGKPARVGYRLSQKNKFRICKKCGADI